MMVGEGGKGSQDFELNLASIIDCLTVLIAFMLASASFLSIGILDAGVAAAGAAPTDTAPPPISVAIELGKDWGMALKITGKENQNTPIPAKAAATGGSQNSAANWDYETLAKQLSAIKAKWPEVNAVVLSADNSVEYKHVVKTMESIRKTMPVVLLGGF